MQSMANRALNKVLLSKSHQLKRLVPSLRLYSQAIYEYVRVSKAGIQNNVGIVQLNRPDALNALNSKLLTEIREAIKCFNDDSSVGAIILTGSEKAFAAGADLKEINEQTFVDKIQEDSEHYFIRNRTTKPLIGAANGFALGGGLELLMTCDIIYAGERAKFGLPEILLGIVPGGGGTQRLARTIGKAKTMEMLLTGTYMTAQEAERMGLISKILPVEEVLDESIKLAGRIANNSHIVNAIAKECVDIAYETTLRQGLRFEKMMSHVCFATKDQKGGMAAFVEEKKSYFTNE